MTGVGVAAGSKEIYLLGHGVKTAGEVNLDRNETLVADFPRFTSSAEEESDYVTAACLRYMDSIANSSFRIGHAKSRKDLITLAWNHLWTFRLISLACRSPFISLFSISVGPKETRRVISNRYGIFPALHEVHTLDAAEVDWARENYSGFWSVMEDDRFQHSLRYLSNSYFIRDPEAQLMLVWAGIERLLGTESELRVAVF